MEMLLLVVEFIHRAGTLPLAPLILLVRFVEVPGTHTQKQIAHLEGNRKVTKLL